ncbi:MAG: alanine--tRNA ligase [Deltaproteobacteria bacterium]|jgi:alanyl-tRNA synthetase|nr:alanine--tRNA ligase [Deltaproteobacteria bacterium]
MNSSQLRSAFIDFFASAGHRKVPSSSLVPFDDQSLLFTNAGMVQFKRLFTGEEKRQYNRAVTSQKCVRAGGKHNDLENVGYTARHHTFFEMLGNFSFGDYFKAEAINFAWTLLTKEFQLPSERLYATIFNRDDDAFNLWRQVAGLPAERIYRLGEKDNFWAMGDVGPCGPCSELLYDQGPEMGCGRPDCAPGCDCDRYLEIWNLVFMQFDRDQSGAIKPLPKPSIDTGMGLERLTAVMMGVKTNFETDLFVPIINEISRISGVPYIYGQTIDPSDSTFQTNVSLRVAADHIRAVTFLINDGVRPDNFGRGYVLRRILRRAARHGRKLGLDKPFLAEAVSSVIEVLGQAYPEIVENLAYIRKTISIEEERFGETLGAGLNLLTNEIEELKKRGQQLIPAIVVFKLYDTYGFPVDLVADMAREHNLSVDSQGFEAAMEEQRARGRAAWKSGAFKEDIVESEVNRLTAAGFSQLFVGYDNLVLENQTPALLIGPVGPTQAAAKGESVVAVFARTPFYASSGGQQSDSGEILSQKGRIIVQNVVKAPGSGVFLHYGQVVDGVYEFNGPTNLSVDAQKRLETCANHTATHLLHSALRQTLGLHARQAGSMVSSERLRFDFTHDQSLTQEELDLIEILVNEEIRADHPVTTVISTVEEAVKSGAMALFEERYGEKVRLVNIGQSKELCGGTHAVSTGRLGFFLILSESAVSAGIRRLECLTGHEALKESQNVRQLTRDVCRALKSPPREILERLSRLNSRLKELEKTPNKSQSDLEPKALAKEAEKINDLFFLARQVTAADPKGLRQIGDVLREALGPKSVVALGAVGQEGKAIILAMVGKEASVKVKAGELIAVMAAAVGGRGGGKADLAQAGGPDVNGLEKALKEARNLTLKAVR